MESSWIVWVSVLLAWTLVGLLVAYLFGGFARRGKASESTTFAPKVVTYLRRQKLAHKPHRASTEAKPRRAAGRRSRH